jgi:hypothetical protein
MQKTPKKMNSSENSNRWQQHEKKITEKSACHPACGVRFNGRYCIMLALLFRFLCI